MSSRFQFVEGHRGAFGVKRLCRILAVSRSGFYRWLAGASARAGRAPGRLSIAVAFFVGTIELVGVLHDKLGLNDDVTGWIAGLNLDNVGYVIVGLFVVVWAAAIAYWRLAKVEERWNARTTDTG